MPSASRGRREQSNMKGDGDTEPGCCLRLLYPQRETEIGIRGTPSVVSTTPSTYTPTGRDRIKLFGNYMRLSTALLQPLNSVERSMPLRFRAVMIIARNTYGREQVSDVKSMSEVTKRMGWRSPDSPTPMNRRSVAEYILWLRQQEWIRARRNGFGREYKLLEPMLALIEPDVNNSTEGTTFVGFFQWPNAFEDVLAPNMPVRLYLFILRLWAMTHGRVNHAKDGIDRMRDWQASYGELGASMGLTHDRDIAKYLAFAERWGFVVVTKHGANRKNSYRPGEMLWRLAKTGDLSPEYRETFGVTSKAVEPSLRPRRQRAA